MVQEISLQEVDPQTVDEIETLSTGEKTYEKRRLRPLASELDFDITHRPSQAKDRVSHRRVYFGIFLGVLLICLGLISNLTLTLENNGSRFVSPEAVPFNSSFSASWLFVGLGVFLIITRLLLLFYSRDFFIGRNFAAVVIQKPFEKSNRMADSLKGYVGVRYRSRIVNVLGLTSYTQHIIDLQHPNEAKTIPLYITRNGEGIREKWQEFALQLGVPAIFNKADGVVEIELADIQKDYASLIKEGKIAVNENDLYKIPTAFCVVEEDKLSQIDPQIRDSAFSEFSAVLCVFSFFVFAFFAFVLTSRSELPSFSFVPMAFVALILFILVPLGLFFRKRRILISKEGIRIKSKWLFFPSFGYLISPERLDSINIIHNSYDYKYSLVIGADGQTTHIGKGMSKQDLDWLENFMNYQIKRFMCK